MFHKYVVIITNPGTTIHKMYAVATHYILYYNQHVPMLQNMFMMLSRIYSGAKLRTIYVQYVNTPPLWF